MNYYNEIRKQRNKMFPPMIGVGCTITMLNGTATLLNRKEVFIRGNGRHPVWDCLVIGKTGKNRGVREIRETKSNFREILGKPVSLFDVLLMINDKVEYDIQFGKRDEQSIFISKIHGDKLYIKLDLTLSIQDQTPEVLEKLLELVQ